MILHAYLTNYRPISNLSIISKITERVVKARLLLHLTTNSLLNSYQSAYTKKHSTETTLLALHNHLATAISHQQVTCLCLLDLSAAFDTIDHAILLQRLSAWFGISSTALQWIFPHVISPSQLMAIYLQVSTSPAASHKALYLAPFSSISIPHLLVL